MPNVHTPSYARHNAFYTVSKSNRTACAAL